MTKLHEIWRQQTLEAANMHSIDELRGLETQHRARIRTRNAVLYAYSAFNVVAGLGMVAADMLPHMHAPMLLMVAAHLFVLWQVWLRRSGRPAAPGAQGREVLAVHRAELEHQYRSARTAWAWFVLPFMPAFVWELAIWWERIDAATTAGAAAQQRWYLVVAGGVLFWSAVLYAFGRHARRLGAERERLAAVAAE